MIFKSKVPDIQVPESDLTSVVLTRVDELGEKAALVDGISGRSISYLQLRELIAKMATGLHLRGFKKGDVFATFMPNVPEYAVVFLGVASAGGINTTVNSLYSTSDLVHQFKDSKAKFLLTIPDFLDRALPAAKECGIEEVFVLGESEGLTPFSDLLDNDGSAPNIEIDPKKDLVALPYSSGTTGLSKGVMLTHENLIANMVLSCQPNPVDETDSMIGVLPFFHIYGMVLILNLAIYRGATLVTMPRFELEHFLQMVQDYKITCLNLVPPIVLALAKHPLVENYDLSSVRIIGCGAAPLGVETEQACAARLDCKIHQGYGLTEVAGASHVNPADGISNKPGAVGPVLPNTASKIVDPETGEQLGANQRGEVLIAGPHVMPGYLNNEEATRNCIDDEGWFHTGDIGYADDDGCFYIVDRVKELIKYKGYQVAPAELEALLVSHSAIADAAVIPSPDEEAGEIPKAFVVLKEEISPEEIMKFIADQVAPHKKIRKLDIVDEIPKAASGKILRRVLVEQERANQKK
ncbi:MAG: AMP-binding protein [Gammaproteobacteria bacterium]|nr:AMP-binding protein [Gammaproteobacteria bacterium]MBT3860799.1 AMP-binding protein [Gammaproteobacteria bacterium]MBT3986946.1 AMP-binding protein [Gammaproteobacteria bacterium]MBT4255050.1 AMP-binding protein [Gammaproteobacteria bacterium]MBT4658724.1 AMP-binding protein [Gammaproteobacteria bacterium]